MTDWPPRILDSAMAPAPSTKVSSMPIRMPGMASGSSISRQIIRRPAPRSRAASTRSLGIMAMPSDIGKSMKGR
ncbi:hypothetical protein D3C87_2136950 [compost metagenome]